MPQRKSVRRLGQVCPALFVIAKSAEAEKAGTTQQSAKQFSQSARRLEWSSSAVVVVSSCFSDNWCGLLLFSVSGILAGHVELRNRWPAQQPSGAQYDGRCHER